MKPEEADIAWEDINFFNNPFSDMNLKPASEGWEWLSEVGLNSPDNTSDGALSKRWVRQGNSTTLLKGSGLLGQEAYNEVVLLLYTSAFSLRMSSFPMSWCRPPIWLSANVATSLQIPKNICQHMQ